MTPDFTPSSRAGEDRLRAFGDALAAGAASAPLPYPSDDLEAMMLRVHRALTATPFAAGTDPGPDPIPADRKAAIWEDIMHQVRLAPNAPIGRPSPARPERAPRPAPPDGTRSRRREWSATASLSVMLALAIGLIGVFVALRFDPPAPDGPSAGVSLFAAPTEPSLPDSCTPNGDVPENDDRSAASLSDWPTPAYAPVERVAYEQGQAIQEAYLMYQRCLAEAFPADGTPPSLPWVYPPNLLSFLSDRQRYLLQISREADQQQTDTQTWACRPVQEDVLASFPLPVNQPLLAARYAGETGTQYAVPIFAPADVYRLVDGRYGAIIGTISTESLQHPDTLTATDNLTFVAFVEKDGRYYLDEDTLILAPDTRRPIIDPPASDPPRTEITYHRLDTSTCANAATPEASATPTAGR